MRSGGSRDGRCVAGGNTPGDRHARYPNRIDRRDAGVQLGTDEREMASTFLVSTVLSVVTMSAFMLLT